MMARRTSQTACELDARRGGIEPSPDLARRQRGCRKAVARPSQGCRSRQLAGGLQEQRAVKTTVLCLVRRNDLGAGRGGGLSRGRPASHPPLSPIVALAASRGLISIGRAAAAAPHRASPPIQFPLLNLIVPSKDSPAAPRCAHHAPTAGRPTSGSAGEGRGTRSGEWGSDPVSRARHGWHVQSPSPDDGCKIRSSRSVFGTLRRSGNMGTWPPCVG